MKKPKGVFNAKNSMCKEGCLVKTPIPEMIKMLLDGEIKSAGKMLFDNNPLSVVCFLICPHEKFCEGHCILGKKMLLCK